MVPTIIVSVLLVLLLAGLTLVRVIFVRSSPNADMIAQAHAAFSYAGKACHGAQGDQVDDHPAVTLHCI
ncbi:hypothetical protein [Pseudodesulfovibrio sediminis]|uniref:Uncharacterized protein n=1 Tax=Pseudodesulfovibrio sediminis TaxID=2810563 RepID=A0ABN6EUT0_9BACT|nr:hypothetical protein [Pseudodesulfovibrio sediminis]BCS88960.1 hypothetical protein PSDVSF_22020 [Pseudodesulfovibrio sediminis]